MSDYLSGGAIRSWVARIAIIVRDILFVMVSNMLKYVEYLKCLV